jgi:hypothetical protein
MSIKELSQKIKGYLALGWNKLVEHEKDLFLTLTVIVVAVGAFGLGRLSATTNTQEPVRIEQVDLDKTTMVVTTERSGVVSDQVPKVNLTASVGNLTAEAQPVNSLANTSKVVVSKNGTKYHLPECSGAKQIKEENKVWFNSIAEAQKAGYTAAANCPGL